jgi:signal transduction histidine kinase/DNA-binding NarL/FixJ family response regulator/ligand-binding sensor domain-containing protein
MYLIRYLALLLLASPCMATTTSDLYPAWRWSGFGSAEGLTAAVSHIREGADGTLWVATTDGVLWFDGYRFIRPPGTEYSVKRLLALPNGNVAFTVDGVLHTGGRDGFAMFPLPFKVFQAIAVGPDVLLLSRTSDLYLLHEGDLQPVALPADARREDVQGLESDGSAIWLRLTEDLFLRQANGWVRESQGRDLRYVTLDHDGRRYGSVELPLEERGLWTWESDGEASPVAGAVQDLIRVIAAAQDGRLLVVYESGAILWKAGPGQAFEQLDPLPEPMRDIHDALFRRNGDLLLATSDGIWLHRTAAVAWKRWHTPSVSARNRVDEILPLRNGDIWIGTDGGVEVRHADGTVSWHEQALGMDLQIITGLAEDADGGVWVSSGAYWDGAFRYHDGQWRFYHGSDGLLASRIHRIHRDDEGRLWFLGLGNPTGASRNSPSAIATYHEGRFGVFDLEGPLALGRVHSFAQGADGAWWFSGVGGIGRYLDGAWSYWNTDNGLRFGTVFALVADPREGGVFFADQNNGLGHVRPDGEITYLGERDGLIHDIIWDLDVDATGALWVATRGGLSSYKDGMWLNFGPDSGLEALELWPVAATEGRILVGSAGKGTFTLDLHKAGGAPPRATYLPVFVGDERVIVRWRALSFEGMIPRDRILTRTRLDGGVFSSWSTKRELSLAGLSAGTHTITVQAASIVGKYDEDGYIETFVVPPRLYSRPVFYLPVAASGLTVILLSIVLVLRRRRDAAALADSEARYRSFFQQAPISLWEQDYSAVKTYLDDQGLADEATLLAHLTPRVVFDCTARIHILDANDATLELFECEDRLLLAQEMHRVFRREAYPVLRQGIVALYGGQTRYSHETVAYSLQGTRRNVILNFTVIPGAREDYSRVLVSVLDVTAQRQAAEEMKAAAQAAEDANVAKSAFLANTSHEIRTPINAVMGMAQALQEEDLSPRAADQVDTVLRASESLAEIIDDLLDLSKIEAGQMELTCLPFAPLEVLEAARRTLSTRATDKGIDLVVTTDPTVPGSVEGDRVRLRQILLNLLGNAVKFTDEGYVRVHMRAVSTDDAVILHVEIHDSGIGIPEDRLQAIFDPFTQGDSSITRTHGGTGLGLSISRRLVEMMGGEIEANSAPGVGSTFRFHIRVAPGSGDVQSTEAIADVTALPMRILLVEDNALNRKVAHALLRGDAHQIIEAENGVVAVERFTEGGSFDVILMDLQMPEMDGVTATTRIRQLEIEGDLRRTPIVALTANAMQADRDRCLQVGMDDFITKPVRKENLRAALARVTPTGPTPPVAATIAPVQDQPVIDAEPLEELRELAESGDFDIAEFVTLFVQTTPECLQRARAALAEQDLETLHREIHTMKGSGREVGARRLAARAEFWEERLKSGDTSDIEAGLDELQQLLEQASQALQAWR